MQNITKPILLFNDECGMCRRIARWVQKAGENKLGETSIVERPIGDDPEALRVLNSDLNIWDAYATIHLLMPDGSMKLGGEAVAEVLRNLRRTKWLARSFAISIFGFRPFQFILNMAYAVLADVRPLFGCESCGTPSMWLRPIEWTIKTANAIFGDNPHHIPIPHFTSLVGGERRSPSGPRASDGSINPSSGEARSPTSPFANVIANTERKAP